VTLFPAWNFFFYSILSIITELSELKMSALKSTQVLVMTNCFGIRCPRSVTGLFHDQSSPKICCWIIALVLTMEFCFWFPWNLLLKTVVPAWGLLSKPKTLGSLWHGLLVTLSGRRTAGGY
jgi:hypothetical protein